MGFIKLITIKVSIMITCTKHIPRNSKSTQNEEMYVFFRMNTSFGLLPLEKSDIE